MGQQTAFSSVSGGKKVAKNVGHFLANKKPLTSMNRQNLEKCGQHNSANVGQMDKAAVQWVVLEYKNILNISTTCSEESYVHMVKKKI